MFGKSLSESKTFWTGVIIVLITAVAQIAGMTFISPQIGQICVAIEAVLFVVLRLITDEPINSVLPPKDGAR